MGLRPHNRGVPLSTPPEQIQEETPTEEVEAAIDEVLPEVVLRAIGEVALNNVTSVVERVRSGNITSLEQFNEAMSAATNHRFGGVTGEDIRRALFQWS